MTISTDEAKYEAGIDIGGWNMCQRHPNATYHALSVPNYYPLFCKVPVYAHRIGLFGLSPFSFLDIDQSDNETSIIDITSEFEILYASPNHVMRLKLCSTTSDDGTSIIARCVELMGSQSFIFDGSWAVSVDYSHVLTKDACYVCIGHHQDAVWLSLFRSTIPSPLSNSVGNFETYYYTSYQGMHYVLSPYATWLGYTRKRRRQDDGTGARELGIANNTIVYMSFSSLIVSSGYSLYDVMYNIPSPTYTDTYKPFRTSNCQNGTIVFMAYDHIMTIGPNGTTICDHPISMVDFLRAQAILVSSVDETVSLISWLWNIIVGLFSKILRFIVNLIFDDFGFPLVYLTFLHVLIVKITGSDIAGYIITFAIAILYTDILSDSSAL